MAKFIPSYTKRNGTSLSIGRENLWCVCVVSYLFWTRHRSASRIDEGAGGLMSPGVTPKEDNTQLAEVHRVVIQPSRF